MKKIRTHLRRTEKAVTAAVCIAGILTALAAAAGCSSKSSNELAQNTSDIAETLPSQNTSDKAESPSQNTSNKAEPPSQNTSDRAEPPSQNTSDKADASTQIASDKAEEAALADAGLTSSEVTFIKTKLDRENGIYVYDIEFYTDSAKYEYEINASTGEVYSKDVEIKSNGDIGQSGSSGGSENYITEDNAKAIAIEHAGFSAADVNFTKVKLDYEDGQRVYEIEFYKDGREYEYEINALSGKVIKYEMD